MTRTQATGHPLGPLRESGCPPTAGIWVSLDRRNIEEAERPLVVDIGGVRVGLLAACEKEFSAATNRSPGANPIDLPRLTRLVLSLRENCDALVVLLHSGREHYPYPTPRQRLLCRWLVEIGAKAVICQHSHCPACYEMVGNSLIVYGQGNFLFEPPGPVPPTWYQGIVVSLELGEYGVRNFELIPFFQPFRHLSEVDTKGYSEASILEGIHQRSAEILREGFVEERWREHCSEVEATYLLWLAGGRVIDRIRLIYSRICGKTFKPISDEAMKRFGLLLRCDTHREILETILSEYDGSNRL